MPQARRKTPFSGKAKKQQLQNKKQNKTLLLSSGGGTTSYDELCPGPRAHGRGGRADAGRYALKFYRETDEELKIKKEDALRAVTPLPPSSLEVECSALFPPALAFPRRPPWDFSMSAAELDAQEHRYFKEYIQKLQSSEHWKHISYFELNLETWRQLWRVLEMCDILLLVADVRYAGMMFPPSLYEHVVKEQGKDMILVLNKVDLVPASVVAAWRQYFLTHCPGLRVVYFTSCPGYNLHGAQGDKAGLVVRRRKGRQRMCVEGATQLVEACEDAAGGRVSLQGWRNKVKEEADEEYDDDEEPQVGETVVEKADTSFYQHERYKNGILTIGCVGSPNAGKSSLINALMGKKVVSVSKTPGHTKHFQTIFLTPQVRLCDCPGLVFPSVVSRPAQILMGCYPIAQLREPYTTIRFMAERLNLPKLLRIQHPEGDDSWSPRDICDGWAKKRGYLTAKAARLDTYRAANSLLRMALDGKLCLWLAPPGFTADREKYETCEEIKYIKWVQALASEDSADQRSSPVDHHSSSGSGEEQDSGTDDEESDASDGEQLQAMANKFAALAGDD